jgi:hypothetical protein
MQDVDLPKMYVGKVFMPVIIADSKAAKLSFIAPCITRHGE